MITANKPHARELCAIDGRVHIQPSAADLNVRIWFIQQKMGSAAHSDCPGCAVDRHPPLVMQRAEDPRSYERLVTAFKTHPAHVKHSKHDIIDISWHAFE